MRVVFFGAGLFAVPSLERLARRHTVVVCVTQPDRPQGRGLRRAPTPVKGTALGLGVRLAQPERLEIGTFEPLEPEIGVAVDYGRLIPQALLAWPPHGMLGVHPSLLPRYRGAAPVAWALLNGESSTGVTIFRLNERMDAGDILAQRRLPIQAGDDAEALTGRLAELGAEELLGALEAVASGRARFRRQDDAQASLAPKLTTAQGVIDWRKPAAAIERQVRAMVPWPGARTSWRGRELKLFRASSGREKTGAPRILPGTIAEVAPEAVIVATGEGTLELKDVQLAGRRRMSVREFLAGHPINVGEILGGER